MFWMNEEQIKTYYDKKAKKAIAKDNAKAEYRRQVLENRKSLFPKFMEIKQLKAKLKEPKIRRRISNILLAIAVLMTAITTLTTVAGGIGYKNTLLTMLTFILFVSFAQGTILLISCLKPYLATKAPRYLAISTLLQLCLLLVSISFNFIFLYNPNNSGYVVFLNIILCIVFDVVILLICELSFVIRLNIQFEARGNRIHSIIATWMDQKLDKIESKLHMDRESIKPVQIEAKEIKQFKNPVPDRDIEAIKQAILKYKNKNIAPSTKSLIEITGLSRNRVIEAKRHLKDAGYLKTLGNTTYINNLEVV